MGQRVTVIKVSKVKIKALLMLAAIYGALLVFRGAKTLYTGRSNSILILVFLIVTHNTDNNAFYSNIFWKDV